MSASLIGRRIKEIRKKRNMTQKELAEGICTQAQISIIEKGEQSPTSHLLYEISKKVNVDMNYFFDIQHEYLDSNETQKVKNLIRKYIRNRDYESLSYIIEKEKENTLFKTPKDKQFLLWHDGICEYYAKFNIDDALNKLTGALNYIYDTPTKYVEREIEILNSIAIIYNEEGNNNQAVEIYLKSLAYFDNLTDEKDQNIKIRILYGLSKSLTDLERYEEAILYCKQGIEICTETEVLYLLGELLYQTGLNLLKIHRMESGNEYFNKAITIFDIQGKLNFINIIKKEQEDLNK